MALINDMDDGVIEVQVIPQDDNWGDAATTITETTATSICTDLEDLDQDFDNDKPKTRFALPSLRQAFGIIFSLLLALVSVLSPIGFVLLPTLQDKNDLNSCVGSCEGLYISLAVKDLVLLIALWALYIRPAKAFTPRVNVFKIALMVLAYIIIICFWLFFALKILDTENPKQEDVINYALSFLDSMLFLHYLSVVLLWLRKQEVIYTISVIRNTDGMRRYYNLGQNSIQNIAVHALEKYYIDFTEYNPYMPRPKSNPASLKLAGLKIYDIDTGAGNADKNMIAQSASRAMLAAAAVGRKRQGRNDRFYEEQEIERRIRKRRARLVCATEEAFGHISRLNAFEMDKKAAGSMDGDEAAQAIFPTLARPLQKYLRTTRQQLRYPLDSIIKHLAHCITFDLSSRAFLERYTIDQPCVSYVGYDKNQLWSLISDDAPSRQIREGTVFQLRREVTMEYLPTY